MVLLHENLATDVVNKLANQPDLVGIMIDIEDYLDNNSLYVFDNWIKGVLVAGPIVKKYWVEVAFKYDLHDMPDPEGALRLTPHGTKVSFKKAEELTGRPWTADQIAQYEANPAVYDQQMAVPQFRR